MGSTIYETVIVRRYPALTVSEAKNQAFLMIDQTYDGKYAGRWKIFTTYRYKDRFEVTFKLET